MHRQDMDMYVSDETGRRHCWPASQGLSQVEDVTLVVVGLACLSVRIGWPV